MAAVVMTKGGEDKGTRHSCQKRRSQGPFRGSKRKKERESIAEIVTKKGKRTKGSIQQEPIKQKSADKGKKR